MDRCKSLFIFTLLNDNVNDIDLDPFWMNLKELYDHFMKNKTKLSIHVDEKGNYCFEDNGI